MLTLSVDVGDWIHKGLKKSAKEVVEHGDELEKHLDELVDKEIISKTQKSKTLDELYEIGEVKRIVYTKGARGSKLLTKVQKTKIIEYTRKYLNDIDYDIIQFADDLSTNNTGYMSSFDILSLVSDKTF